MPRVSFEKYVDSMLDLLIDGQTPGIKDKLLDHYGKQEILFFGPDEGTADFMDWASCHAKKRGARFWKAFTTGKSQSLGGIPHDLYGMTTRSVHQYVLGIYRKLNIKVCIGLLAHSHHSTPLCRKKRVQNSRRAVLMAIWGPMRLN